MERVLPLLLVVLKDEQGWWYSIRYGKPQTARWPVDLAVAFLLNGPGLDSEVSMCQICPLCGV